ncbi:GIY-YIG nuclease family protein [Patescibacteria group bacterium]|nr:GIY-YIG nuclease family protein [Patescibacteria group bacterium]
MFFVYVLYSFFDKKLYIGYTPDDVYRRLEKHLAKMVAATKYRLPLKLIFYEVYFTRKDALRREKYFKTSSGKRALKFMLRETFNNLREE